MASPMPIAPSGGWNPNGQAMPPNNNNVDENGMQVRTMGLKVHYTFDKENKVNCLARSSQTLQVQTIALDGHNSIGVVDLRACLQTITECSPELGTLENDYTVYALDYSEPDTPLVGQGMLSWALESMRNDHIAQLPKMVTGRVTKNMLAVFAGGNREILEVKLRLAPAAKPMRHEPSMDMQMMRPMETAMTPTGASEWNSFIQSNPQIGHTAPVSRVASPALSQGAPTLAPRRDSFGPSAPIPIMPSQEIVRVAPVPVDPTTIPPQPSSRPSSRSSRRKQPTGRPRGRPRKKPVEGNTSGYEDGTEGEEGPAKKRAKTTKVEKAAPNPFGTEPDSLRVAASISGSLRNFRPIAANSEGMPGNHLQEVPRAPTPVPGGGAANNHTQSGPNGKPRRESSMRQEFNPNQHSQQPGQAPSPTQEDGRSPDSLAPTPNYSEDSPQDIGSSPPVARTTPFIRSSPPPSSPMLPPMPQRADASFMSTEMNTDLDDLFDESLLQPLKDTQLLPEAPLRKVAEVTDATGIPTQVFQIQDGPGGQDLVHIQNYNSPIPTSTPAGPPIMDGPSLPPLKKNSTQARSRNPAPKRSRPSPPALALTPPPTTDIIEKPTSPARVFEFSMESTTESGESAEGPGESSSAEPAPAPEVFSTQDSAVQPTRNPTSQGTRHLGRSQSAGPLAFPTVPASEPADLSTPSQLSVAEPLIKAEVPPALKRSNSFSPMSLLVAASDPIGLSLQAPTPLAELPVTVSHTPIDLPPAPSSPPTRSNKNMVKKQSIKERLEKAIANGEMPPFCTNCGAIETPTWRKIWVQDHEGTPDHAYDAEKHGLLMAVEVIKRDAEQKPILFRLIKKSLSIDDDRSLWTEQLLCNPCGIWVTKYRAHRPQDKWDNCFGRLGQERRKRGPGQNNSRSKKARTKSDSQPNPTSEAYPATDPIGPVEPSSPKPTENMPHSALDPGFEISQVSKSSSSTIQNDIIHGLPLSNPGSTHSRGSGTARSPINVELDEQLGSTRRLLFPSPRKDNITKALGDLSVNIAQTLECRQTKELAPEKENVVMIERGEASNEHDDLEALFQSPLPARPSTPPAKAKTTTTTTPFKTPTRPTPNHRPITRSVSRSLRSVRDILASPNHQALLQRTPTQTPRGTVRRSPRTQVNFDNVFDTPLSRTISQMLSDPAFDLSNNDLDLSSLPALETNQGSLIDFGSLLSTDGVIPSSPPKDGALAFDYNGSSEVWSQWAVETKARVEETEE